MTGSGWHVEGTGGGCEVLSTRLEGGFVLVLEQNLSAPEWAVRDEDGTLYNEADYWTLGAYRPGAWMGEGDDTEPVVSDAFVSPLTPDTLREALETLLRALPTLLRF